MNERIQESARFEGFSLKGLRALVTGGGTHLGFAMAAAVAEQGAQVTVLARSEEFLKTAVEKLGEGHDLVTADLMDEATYEMLLKRDVHYDIIVNNAGGDPWDNKWEDQTTQAWLDTYHLNVVTANRLAQTFVPGMRERGFGRLINIASVYGMVAPNPKNRKPGYECAAYTAAKHGVVGLTRFLAAKLGRAGITAMPSVPACIPWPTTTPISSGCRGGSLRAPGWTPSASKRRLAAAACPGISAARSPSWRRRRPRSSMDRTSLSTEAGQSGERGARARSLGSSFRSALPA